MGDRGALQLDIGLVVSSLGGNSSQDRNQFHGLFSFFGIDFGIYIGPSYNLFERIGPSIGAGLLIGQNGFLAGKVGIHFNRTFGLAILIPIVPIYGGNGRDFLIHSANSSGRWICGCDSTIACACNFRIPGRAQKTIQIRAG